MDQQDAVGRRFRTVGNNGQLFGPWRTIVGVVGDTMITRAVRDMPQPVYLAMAQGQDVPWTLFVRAAGDPSTLVRPLRAAIRRIDRTQPADQIERLDESVRKRFGGTPLITGILGGFGAFALALAGLGVFSVVSYMVAERTREFGIRIALGATRRDILWLVVRQAVVIVILGAGVSITGTLAVTRAAFLELAQLAATDTMLWSLVTALLALVALGASLAPARRATRVEPVVALRSE